MFIHNPQEKLEVILAPNTTTCDNISIRFQLLRIAIFPLSLTLSLPHFACNILRPLSFSKSLKTTDFLDVLIKFHSVVVFDEFVG
jgi:hypothetical protein